MKKEVKEPQMDHFSIDLETLHTRYDAAILSIGCAQFDPMTGKIGLQFYREIDFDASIKHGAVSGSTLRWWSGQSDKARRIFGTDGKVGLAQALDEFTTWMRARSMAPKVWGNGATFDITILEHAYAVGCVGLQPPWHFTNIRDMRTIVDVAGVDPGAWPFPKDGVAHNAAHDAKRQAEIIAACWQKIKKSTFPGGEPEKTREQMPNQPVEKVDSPGNSGPAAATAGDDDL